MFLNGTRVGRDEEQKCDCICNQEHWKPYCVPVFDGTSCVVTTDVSCLSNKNAAAVLSLQAGFRYEYCPKRTMDDLTEDDVMEEGEWSFFSEIDHALREHVMGICEEFDVGFVLLSEWFNAVLDLSLINISEPTRPY